MDEDDFDFSDHDLDDLPANALHHLEASAIRATQIQPQPQSRTAPESDYGLDDGDEVVNLDDTGPSPYPHAHAPAHTHHGTSYALPESHHRHEPPFGDQMEVEEPPRRSQPDPAQLLQRIKKLEQEKARERRDLLDLQSKLQTKSGEADTLRRRHDAESRRLERQLADQQQAHATEMARLRVEMEKLRREKESVQTDNMFNQHEVRDVNLAKRTGRNIPSRPKPAAPNSPGTPKRAQKSRGPLGDGFDNDDHIPMASPSKTRERQKTLTPRQAGKRKRQVTDQSPIPLPVLQLSEPRNKAIEKAQEPAAELRIDAALLQHFRRDDRRYNLLHQLLAYPSSNGTDRILEALTQYAFPSDPTKKLSSIVYDALARSNSNDVHQLALFLCNTFCDLWKRCQNEKYYAPTSLILDALHFVLACEPINTAVQVGQRVVPLIIAFVDLVSDPVSKAAKGGERAIASLYSAAQLEIASHIDVLDCLELLHLIATSCVSCSDSSAITNLWQAIPSTFACMLLIKEQPRPHIELMLQILTTSALTDSLGPIATDEVVHDSQTSNEDALINRLTNLLTEMPRPIPDPSLKAPTSTEVSEAEVWNLRLLVISVLTQFCIHQQGCSRLAQNRVCIGRLVKYLDYCITSLYRHPLSPTQDQKIESINITMRLIYHITTSNAEFDIKSKLVNTLGGQHAYLVALTRLAFSEGLMLEYGIEDDVVNMAHDILDEGLSLEEGDAFGKVFSSGSTAL